MRSEMPNDIDTGLCGPFRPPFAQALSEFIEVITANWVESYSELERLIVKMDAELEEFVVAFVPSTSRCQSFIAKARSPFQYLKELRKNARTNLCATASQNSLRTSKRQSDRNSITLLTRKSSFPSSSVTKGGHATRPDNIASLPGRPLEETYVTRKTLMQLSKSAHNILVAQSRPFVSVGGIYGSFARIFRFDHAGALCSRPFKYTERKGSILQLFLWCSMLLLDHVCDAVGAGPTVALASSGQRVSLLHRLESMEIAPENRNEVSKAFHWMGTMIRAIHSHVYLRSP